MAIHHFVRDIALANPVPSGELQPNALMKVIGLLFLTVAGASAALIESPQKGGLKISSLSALSFGPEGLLLVAEPGTASVLAIQKIGRAHV